MKLRLGMAMSVAALVLACGNNEYSITIVAHDVDAIAQGLQYQLYALKGTCPPNLDPRFPIADENIAANDSWIASGQDGGAFGPAIGVLPEGRYGFLVRVKRPDDCQVHWAACEQVDLHVHGGTIVALFLSHVVDAPCDDGIACNGKETCQDFVCTPGMPVVCTSSIACVMGQCTEPAGTCSKFPDHSRCTGGQACDVRQGCVPAKKCSVDIDCDDKVFCNGMESCFQGVCVPGEMPCDDHIACHVNSCDGTANKCIHTLDDKMCPSQGSCEVGACIAAGCATVARNCDDGDPCTDDACQEGVGCIHTVRDADGDSFNCHNDCNDNDPNIHPGVMEICNGIDDNCNGLIDEGGVCNK